MQFNKRYTKYFDLYKKLWTIMDTIFIYLSYPIMCYSAGVIWMLVKLKVIICFHMTSIFGRNYYVKLWILWQEHIFKISVIRRRRIGWGGWSWRFLATTWFWRINGYGPFLFLSLLLWSFFRVFSWVFNLNLKDTFIRFFGVAANGNN